MEFAANALNNKLLGMLVQYYVLFLLKLFVLLNMLGVWSRLGIVFFWRNILSETNFVE